MTTIQEAITDAKRVKAANKMEFATIWRIGKNHGFNFDKQELGYSIKEYGVKRTVVAVV